MARQRESRKNSRHEPPNLVEMARCAVPAAFSGGTIPPAVARAETSQRDVPTKVRVRGEGIASLNFKILWLEFESAICAGCRVPKSDWPNRLVSLMFTPRAHEKHVCWNVLPS
jgi:hypothetical protein